MTRLDRGMPTWLRDIDATLPVTPTFVLHGNLRDRYLLPRGDQLMPVDLIHALWETLSASGFEAVVHCTPGGLSVVPETATPLVSDLLGRPAERLRQSPGPDQLADFLTRTVTSAQHRVALVIDYVSQWRPPGERFTDSEHALMVHALESMHRSTSFRIGTARQAALYNSVFWLVDQPADLPPWLVGGFGGIRQISVPTPDLTTRAQLARLVVPPAVHGPGAATRFAERTEGMTIRSMMEIVQLAMDQNLSLDRIEDAVRSYRVGLVENPWARVEIRERVRDGTAVLGHRVLGQTRAVRHALDILIRSVTGMTGAERGGGSGGPRGILFFAGPTGVGKTELAKALTQLVFGDERAYVRFDMSEFSSEHSEARLIGSPPGYIGHGDGGDLTNSVRQKPYAVVLFDEVEKAHPRILDKFLQILSDGRLTDGSGDTVHFSECLIVFTSNLGVPPLNPDEPIPRGRDLEQRVRAAIEHEFRHGLERPELLGRIGEDNIVVFDYLTPEVAADLANRFIDNVLTTASREHSAPLTMTDDVRGHLVATAIADLSLGGRGVAGAIESNLTNPLSRALFEQPPPPGSAVIDEIVWEEDGWNTVRLRPTAAS